MLNPNQGDYPGYPYEAEGLRPTLVGVFPPSVLHLACYYNALPITEVPQHVLLASYKEHVAIGDNHLPFYLKILPSSFSVSQWD